MNHVLNEVVQRLRDRGSVPPSFIKILGIDPDAEPISDPDPLELLPSGDNLSGEGPVLRGEVPFELHVSVLGEPATQDCRIVFAATLIDDERQQRRVLGRLTMYYEMLEWRDLENGERLPVPAWTRRRPRRRAAAPRRAAPGSPDRGSRHPHRAACPLRRIRMSVILNEVLHRLRASDQVPAEIARAVGVDPDTAVTASTVKLHGHHSLISRADESLIYRGEVPFELKVSAFGLETVIDCRAVFETTLCDDEDRFTNEPIRVLGACAMQFEAADWRDLDEMDEDTGEHLRLAAPRWVSAYLEPLLPPGVMRRIDDSMEEQARELERLSNS